ncbi:MAG: hypothetical protein HS122_05255 [Opitutaceae bacterium]|nr:hypothetical protein [Opitutaceae bacterium]
MRQVCTNFQARYYASALNLRYYLLSEGTISLHFGFADPPGHALSQTRGAVHYDNEIHRYDLTEFLEDTLEQDRIQQRIFYDHAFLH